MDDLALIMASAIPAISGVGKSTSALKEKSGRGLKLFSAVADTMIEAEFGLMVYRVRKYLFV
jgi:hypothetical protein